MDLGKKLKQARLEAGLSQRQLCADMITRNMLSQIENGTAKPSMGTLSYLAERLGKPVSFFLEENAVTSPNQMLMEEARDAFRSGDWGLLAERLKDYRQPDPVFDPEFLLLSRICYLKRAEGALQRNQTRLAETLLEELGPIGDGYCPQELERQRLLLLAQAQPKQKQEICRRLPSLDGELMLRAEAELEQGDLPLCDRLLECVQERRESWYLLRGELYFVRKEYAPAAECFLKAEGKSARRLEQCYRELGNFERAYYYACMQR